LILLCCGGGHDVLRAVGQGLVLRGSSHRVGQRSEQLRVPVMIGIASYRLVVAQRYDELLTHAAESRLARA